MQAPDPRERLIGTFGGGAFEVAWAPGRVNLIGEHIDYHGLAVLPMALERRIRVAFRAADRPANSGRERRLWDGASSSGRRLTPVAARRLENYLRAAAWRSAASGGSRRGVDAAVVSDLPAAGRAVLFLRAAGGLHAGAAARPTATEPAFEDLMEVLPEGEQFVGTRGGGMDHAASLASRGGCASLMEFAPLSRAAHSGARRLELSGGAQPADGREIRRGARGVQRAARRPERRRWNGWGWPVYREAMESDAAPAAGDGLAEGRSATPSCTSPRKRERVRAAVDAMERGDAAGFGRTAGGIARQPARPAAGELPGAGPAGGSRHGIGRAGRAADRRRIGRLRRGALPTARELPPVRRGLIERYYARPPRVRRDRHLIDAAPGAGALAP